MSRSAPLISVITVCFNSEDYIEQCINSVIEQTYDNFEYVVIDGGSNDGTVEILKKYDEDIAYWHSRPDNGLANAFNLAVENSSGQWLIFINSDDYFYSSSVLENIASDLLVRPEHDVVYGQVYVVSRKSAPTIVGGPYGDEYKWESLLKSASIPHQGAFTNCKYFQRVGGFDEKYQVAVDYEHYLRGGNGMLAEYIPVPVAYMREDGMGKRLIYDSLREWLRAQVCSGKRSVFAAQASYYLNVTKVYIKSVLEKLVTKGGYE